jgi:hypothetical protein
MWISWWCPRPFQLNSCKNFKNRVGGWYLRGKLSWWKMVSSIILSPQHSQNDKWLWMLGKTLISPEKLIQEGCWTVNHFVMDFFHFAFCFGVTSHPLTKHVFSLSLCCSKSMRCLFQCVFWQKKNDRTPTCKIKASQS